jgi:hypothetical protein
MVYFLHQRPSRKVKLVNNPENYIGNVIYRIKASSSSIIEDTWGTSYHTFQDQCDS